MAAMSNGGQWRPLHVLWYFTEMENTLDVDKLLKCAGDSGVYQITTFALIGVVVFFSVESFAINFIAGKMDHWCQVPGLQSYSYEEQLNVGIPLEDIGGGQQRHSRCYQYSHDFEQYTRHEIMHWNRTLVAANMTKDDWMQCNNWTYDQSVFISSAVSEVCSVVQVLVITVLK